MAAMLLPLSDYVYDVNRDDDDDNRNDDDADNRYDDDVVDANN